MAWSDAVVRLAEAVGLKGKPEAPKAKEPVRAEAANADTGPRIGSHGIDYTAGVFHEEYHADLDTYADRVDRFNELRVGDSVIASQLLRLETPIAQARWTFEPPEGDQPLPSEAAAEEQGAEGGQQDDAEDTAEGEPQPETDKALADAPPPVIAPAERVKKQPADPAEMQAKLAEADADERTVRLLKANLLGQGAHEYRMCQPWRQFLHEAQTARAFGFSLFERTYRRVTEGPMGKAVVVDGLWWMHPRSIERWHLDENGELLGIVQTTQHYSYDGDALDAKPRMEYRRVYIPADRLVVITRHKEGAHVEGVGTIRHVYGDAKHAAYLRKATRIDASKRAIGIPRVAITSDASPEVKSLAIQQAKRMRMGDERLFVVDTPGVTTGFVDMQANTLDVSGHMRGAEDRIRMAHGTEWSALGSTGAGGSYSAGDVQSRYFNIVLEADAEWLRESIQRQIVEPLAALNSSGGSPVLRVYDVSPREIGPILEAKKASLLTWTAEDEQDIRRQLRLRQLTDEELSAREQKKAMGEALAAAAVGVDPEQAKAGGEPPKPGAKPAPPVAPPAAAMPKELAASPKRRPLTDWEARYHDAQTIEEERAAMVRDFLQALKPLRDEAAREAVRKATIKGASIVVPRLKRKALEETIARFILRARELGRDTMREEVRRQVADLTAPEVALAELPPFDPKQTPRAVARAAAAIDVSSLVAEIDAEMQALTVLNVDQLLGSVEATVKRQLLNAMSQYSDEEIAREIALREALDGGKVETERIARESVNRGIVNGRAEVAEQASETLAADGLTLETARRTHVGEDEPCAECVALDGQTYTVGSPDYYANMPPAKCLGGSYCHCQYVYEVTK